MKKISLIIPVYNEKPWLRRCLDSVAAALPQDDSVEVIVVDDGSTDGSSEICSEYSDQRCFRVFHKENGGVSSARNFGLRYAKGEWITFLDSDDVLNRDGFTVLLESIEEYGEQNHIIGFNHMRYYPGAVGLVAKNTNSPGVYDCREILPTLFCMVWNKVYPRSLLEKCGVAFKLGMQYGEDEIFNLRCFEHDPIMIHVDRAVMTKHFDNPNSLVRTVNEQKLLAQNDALCELLRNAAPDNYAFKNMVRSVLGEHWNSQKYTKTFAGTW